MMLYPYLHTREEKVTTRTSALGSGSSLVSLDLWATLFGPSLRFWACSHDLMGLTCLISSYLTSMTPHSQKAHAHTHTHHYTHRPLFIFFMLL